MKIYRIENIKTMHGMFYDSQGNFNPYINNLTEGNSRHLPMEYNPLHKLNNKNWFSGCGSKEQMRQWFSKLDAQELYSAGYVLYEFESDEFQVLEHEVLFTREGMKKKKAIPLEVVWGSC